MKKKILILVLVILLIVAILFGLYKLMNARNFQVFGGLTSHVETKEKLVALTFDDGPTERIKDILPLLDKYNAKATFFVIGSELEDNLHLGKEIANANHQLGNHTYSHKRMIFKSLSYTNEEIKKTNELIKRTGFKGEIDFRPPNGKKLFELPYVLKKYDMDTIMWDLEPDSFYTSAKEKINYVNTHIQPGSIILLHPMYTDDEMRTIEGVLKLLTEKGYKFVTVNELQSIGSK